VGIRRWIVNTLGRDFVKEQIDLALAESMMTIGIDPDDADWRSLTTKPRDLPAVTHDWALEIAHDLYLRNPLGHRITELNRDFVVGAGLSTTFHNPAVADIVSEFWYDEDNRLDLRLPDFCLELGLNGELIPEVQPQRVSRFVKLGYIDPMQVKKVEHVSGNALIRDVVWIKKKGMGIRGEPLQIVRRRDIGRGRNRSSRLEGEVFFWTVNSTSNATRGWPDLLHIADWLDAYNEYLWEVLERARSIRAFVWDVLVKGLKPHEVQGWLRAHGDSPKAGSVLVHNENETWSAVAPQLGSFEMAEEGEVLLEHIAGGSGFQKAWLGSADDVNRATAREMGSPTERRLAFRQARFVTYVRDLLKYVLEQAERAGRFLGDVEEGTLAVYDAQGKATQERRRLIDLVEIHSPQISPRDAASAGTMMLNVTQALQMAAQRKWIDVATSQKILASILAHLGVTVEAATMALSVDSDPDPETLTPPGSEQPSTREMAEALVALGNGHADRRVDVHVDAPSVEVNPEVNVHLPDIEAEIYPEVSVDPPTVHVEPPHVDIHMPDPPKRKVTRTKQVRRDKKGEIAEVVETEES
jgi:hypothetical protein